MKSKNILIAWLLVMPAFMTVLSCLPIAGAQPPLLGDWVITGSETLTGGTYEVHDGDIIIRDGATLTLDGTEIRMDDTTWPTFHVEVQSGGTLIMKNNALIRSEYNNSGVYYFYIRKGSTVDIRNSNISDVGDTWAGWQNYGIFIESDDVTIQDSDITRGGYGLMMYDCSPTIANNTIYNNGGIGIYTEIGEPRIYDNTITGNGFAGPWWSNYNGISVYDSNARIEGNTINNNGWNGGNQGGGIQVSLSDVVIANNTIRNNANLGIDLDNHATAKIVDNVIRNNGNTAVGIWDHSEVKMFRNNIYSLGEYALYVSGTSNPTARDNYFNTTDATAVRFTGSSVPVFEDNTIDHWAGGEALSISDDSKPVIKGNDIYSDSGRGINIWHWVLADIEDNTIDAGSVGIEVYDFSKARIVGNDIVSRWTHGLNVGYYSEAFGHGNTINSLDEGIEMWSYSSMELMETEVTSDLDHGVEVRGRSTLFMDGATIQSKNHIGVYVQESTVDIINASIAAPNNDDIRMGYSAPEYPGLLRCLNTTFNQSDVGFDNDFGRLNVSWYAEKIWVEWQNDRNVPNPDVWIENIHGNVVYSTTANEQGEIYWLPVQEYTQNRTLRNDYTRHNFSAEKNGRSSYAGANVNQNVNVRIILQDNVNDPLIGILNPIDGGIYNSSVIWANGTATDPESGIYEVRVWPVGLGDIRANGTDVWGTNVTLPDGEWVMTVNATNYAGVQESESVTITVDTVPPELTVAYPAPIDLVNTTNITVVGSTEPGAVVTIDGLDATVDMDGNFNLTITLPEGVNTVTVASHDEALNWNISTHIVTVDLTPPPLVVFNPPEDIITTKSPIVASGWVEVGANLTMNGAVIEHPGEPFATTVVLTEGVNRLEFVAVDPAGNSATVVRTVIYDTTPPAVDISHPPVDHLTNMTDLNVTGWTDDLTLSKITVNGNEVTADIDGNFSLVLNLSEGLNEVEIMVVDEAGHITIVRRMVELDTVPPPLEVTTPDQDLLTNDPQLHVTGSTELFANVTVNGQAAPLDEEGTFDIIYTLIEGANVVTITSRDPAGNPAVIVRNVFLDTQAPVLKVSSPKKGATQSETELEVSGKVTDNLEVAKLTINGKAVKVKNGKFSTVVALKSGSNKLVFVATDTAGNEVEESVTVTREGLTALESGLLGLGIIFLVIGLAIGMFMGKGKPRKAPPPQEEPSPFEEEAMTPSEDDNLDEGPQDDGPEAPEDGPEPETREPEDNGPGPEDDGPAPGTSDERKVPEGKEAEDEAPPEDDSERSLQSILDKMKS